MAITRRQNDIDLTDRFDLSEFPIQKPKRVKNDLTDIWYALGGLPAIRVTPDMVLALIQDKATDIEADHEETLEASEQKATKASTELEELKEDHKKLELDYEKLHDEHEELKEQCWSAFEMEPDTIQSLKNWLRAHDN